MRGRVSNSSYNPEQPNGTPRPGRRRRSSSPRSVPQSGQPQTGWGAAQPPQRRPEAAYEQTGTMPAHPQPQTQQPPRRRAMEETAVSQPVRRQRPGGPGGPGGGGGKREDDDEERPRWRRFIPSWKIVLAGFAVLTAGLFGMIAVAYAGTPVPTNAQEGVDDQGSVIYYANGEPLARLGVKRKPVTYAQIPRAVQDAVIAAENSSFRDDAGISFSGMVRSVWSTATGQQIQGASTITQQMARNYYDGLSKEVSVQRKIKEIFVAVKLNKTKPKEWILEQYLNTIYFGRGAYGIGAAAEAFFGKKKVEDLTPEEGAYLAGRIQNPDAFDRAEKAKNLGPTEFRYDYVIGQMAKLDAAKYGGLAAKTPTAPKRKTYTIKDYFTGLKGYMVISVLNELERRGITREAVDTGGYRITSTFDKKLMNAAKAAVHQHTRGLPKEINATLAAVDPRNGRVVAFYGGDNYATDSWNDAFLSQKQAASAFKPYVLAAWLQSGYSLRSYVPTKGPVKLAGTTPITNDHSMKSPAIDVIGATAQSVNTAYAKMGEKVGLDMVVDIASQAGIDKERLEAVRSKQNFLITIGSSEVTAVEQAGGYSIFANGGKHFDNHVVIKVVDKNKLKVIEEDQTPNQVISPDAAADAVVALEAVVKSGTGRNARLYDRPVAGKTGTNNQNKEAWFVGFAPQLSTAVGMFRQECRTSSGKVVTPVYSNCPWYRGKDSSKETKYTPQKPYSTAFEVPLGSAFQGATYPASIWKSFMTEALKGQKVEQFPARANTGTEEDLVPKPEPTPTKDPAFPDDEQTECGLFEVCDEPDVTEDPDNVTDDGIGTDTTDVEGGDGGPGRQDITTVPDPIPTRRDDG